MVHSESGCRAVHGLRLLATKKANGREGLHVHTISSQRGWVLGVLEAVHAAINHMSHAHPAHDRLINRDASAQVQGIPTVKRCIVRTDMGFRSVLPRSKAHIPLKFSDKSLLILAVGVCKKRHPTLLSKLGTHVVSNARVGSAHKRSLTCHRFWARHKVPCA